MTPKAVPIARLFLSLRFHGVHEFQTPICAMPNEGKTSRRRPDVPAAMAAARFSGPIVTLKIFEDNSLVREAFGEDPGRASVLVIDGGGSMRCAMVGDQLAIWRQEWLGRHRRLRLHPRLGRHQRHRHRRLRPRHASAEEHQEGRPATNECGRQRSAA
jgi:hypothetical protein